MDFVKHSNLVGQHAYLGASQWHWINYDEQKLIDSYKNFMSVQRGTELHEFAAQAIKLGVKLKPTHNTLNMYVNDAIGFRLTPEVPLYYSENCFGTADAIAFNEKNNFLRIHDLKTGKTPAHFEQLLIYTALFCLEYKYKPSDIDCELRLYQSDDIRVLKPAVDDILPIMDKIVTYDKVIQRIKQS